MDPALVLLVAACAFATSALTAVLGFGGGIVLLAVLVAFLDPLVAIPLHAAIQVVSNGTRTIVRRRDVDWRIVWRTSLLLLPAGLLTLSLARQAPDAVLQIAIAVTVLAATWLPVWLSRPLPAPSSGGWIAMGGVLGALNPVVGATGPLAAPFFRREPVTASASSARSPRPRWPGTWRSSCCSGRSGCCPPPRRRRPRPASSA